MKEFFRENFPRSFIFLRSIKDQLLIEYRTIKALGARGLVTAFFVNAKRDTELPIQSINRYAVSGIEMQSHEDVADIFKSKASGAHSVYLSPEEWSNSSLSSIQSNFPSDAGLKIIKHVGTIESPYVKISKRGHLQSHFLPNQRQQILVMNYFYRFGLGPRLYDIIEIDGGAVTLVAYVVQNATQKMPSNQICLDFVSRLKEFIAEGKLQLINWNGFQDGDFACPSCNQNLMIDKDNNPIYVDTQNFSILNYPDHLHKTAIDAQAVSHYGDRSHLLGGRYLYQAIPGVKKPSKRDPAYRMSQFNEMMDLANLSLKGRLVLDVGCNLGLMGAQYLKHNALWTHGWDTEQVIKHAERVLLAVGCTRFSLSGTNISQHSKLIDDLPPFLEPHLGNCVLSYLAIRRHVGWIAALKSIPWSFMIYEGHEEEGKDISDQHFAELNQLVPIEVITEKNILDGTSRARHAAILRRKQ